MPAPVLPEILRQHAEQAAFLWTVYDRHMLYPEENKDMDEDRLGWLIERLEAHLDGLRVAGDEGRRMAEEVYAEYPEAGELFVVRMLTEGGNGLRIRELDLEKVRGYLREKLA